MPRAAYNLCVAIFPPALPGYGYASAKADDWCSSTKRMSEVLGSPQASSFSSKDFMDTVNKFQAAVNRFKESLPEPVKLCPQAIHDYVLRPDRTAFITLHLWVAQTHMDLYRFSMPKLKKTAVPEYPADLPWEWLDMAQRQATAYAIHQAQFWTYQLHIIQEKGALSKALMTVDWMIGACAVDCSTLLLTARKHELWRRDLKEGSTAPLCLAKPIDDVSNANQDA